MKRIVLSMLLAVGSFIFCMAQEVQEVVYLKNGSIIKGTVIEQVPGKSLKIQTDDGSIFAYEMSEVEKITQEQNTAYGQRRGQRRSGQFMLDGNGVQRGYRGFVDLGYTIGKKYGENTNRIEIATSHGYQFNPYFYAGLGAGVNYYHKADVWEVPVFADLRTDMLDNWITPYVDFRIGYSVYDETGFYMSPTVGCRFNFGNNLALNFGIGYTLQKVKVWGCEVFYIGKADANGNVTFYPESNYYWESIINYGGFSIKLGIEF